MLPESAKAKQEVSKEKRIVISEISKVSLQRDKSLEVSKSLDEQFVATKKKQKKMKRPASLC